jgi:hypothetical protein
MDGKPKRVYVHKKDAEVLKGTANGCVLYCYNSRMFESITIFNDTDFNGHMYSVDNELNGRHANIYRISSGLRRTTYIMRIPRKSYHLINKRKESGYEYFEQLCSKENMIEEEGE